MRSFGKPEPSHGVRSAVFDEAARAFVLAHPDAVIVDLGEGLETRRFRDRMPRRLSLRSFAWPYGYDAETAVLPASPR